MFRRLVAIGLVMISGMCQAEGELHIKFHLAVSEGVGGALRATLVNTGDADIYKGYLVVTMLDENCHPLASRLGQFQKLGVAEKMSLSIPLMRQFATYRITSMAAFDQLGTQLKAVDDNAEILANREKERLARCK